MRQVTFQTGDGTVVTLDVQPKFEQVVREQLEIDSTLPVTDADLKRFFIASMIKASE